jgi:hypothetical protein
VRDPRAAAQPSETLNFVADSSSPSTESRDEGAGTRNGYLAREAPADATGTCPVRCAKNDSTSGTMYGAFEESWL